MPAQGMGYRRVAHAHLLSQAADISPLDSPDHLCAHTPEISWATLISPLHGPYCHLLPPKTIWLPPPACCETPHLVLNPPTHCPPCSQTDFSKMQT